MSAHRNRYLLLLVYALIALPPMGYGAWQAPGTNANSPLDWVADWFPARHAYQQFRTEFGAGDVVVVSWPGCTVDDPRLDRLVKVLRESLAFRDAQGHWYFERVVTGAEPFRSLTAAPMALPRREVVRRLRGTSGIRLSGFGFRLLSGPGFEFAQCPLRRFVSVAAVATVGGPVPDSVGRRDEVERMVDGFSGNGILAGFGHVTSDTAAADARWGVMGVLGENGIIRTCVFAGTVAGQTEGVGVGRFDVQGTIA